jgi:hypothetical protein
MLREVAGEEAAVVWGDREINISKPVKSSDLHNFLDHFR